MFEWVMEMTKTGIQVGEVEIGGQAKTWVVGQGMPLQIPVCSLTMSSTSILS